MGNAHTHQLVGCESNVQMSRRLASVIDACAADRSGDDLALGGYSLLTQPIIDQILQRVVVTRLRGFLR